ALLSDTAALPELNAVQRDNVARLAAGIPEMVRLARSHHIPITFSSDALGPPEMMARRQLGEFAARARWFSAVEVLRQATSTAARLLALSGPRNPYPYPLGVIREGAAADLLVLEGNPLDDVTLLANPETNLRLIIKDGAIIKNTL